MAIRLSAATTYLRRTASLPPVANCTIMGWVRLAVLKGNYVAFFAFGQSTGGTFFEFGLNGDDTLHLYNGTTSALGTTMAVGSWHHCSLVVSGTGASQVVGRLTTLTGVTQTLTADGNAAITAQEFIGGSGNSANLVDYLDGSLAALKVYNRALTFGEILTEMPYYAPQSWADLNAWYPLLTHADVEDAGRSGIPLVANGALTTEEGPFISWAPWDRRSAITAIAAAAGDTVLQSSSSSWPNRGQFAPLLAH